MLQGSLSQLSQEPCETWRGWAMYFWDMRHCVALFRCKPVKIFGEYSHGDAVEHVSPYFLTACGIDVTFDVMGEASREFYYGQHSDGYGQHDPVRIELRLPKSLLTQLGLT